MNTYFLDTNVILRVLLNDNPSQAQQGKEFFDRARQGELTLVIIPAIILEIEYVLRKVYQVPREERRNLIVRLIETPYLEIRDRKLLQRTLDRYNSDPFDLVDFFLFESAQDEGAEVLSFDKDFKKLV